jgi:acyl dehydratase
VLLSVTVLEHASTQIKTYYVAQPDAEAGRSLGMALAAEGARLEVRFVRPVREDDVVSASGRLVPGSDATYDVTVANQKGEAVITGTLSLAT